MNKAQLKQKILNVLNGMSESERVAIYQSGCRRFGWEGDMIFPMSEFDEREDKRPFSEVYRDLAKDFSFNDDYYYLDGYLYYHSLSNITDDDYCAKVLDDFINYMIKNEYGFGSPKIAEVFEEVRSEEK